MMRMMIALAALPSLAIATALATALASAPAQWLQLAASMSEGALGEAAGDYYLDGEAHGYPKYKQQGEGTR
jgi:hypothetical protein